MRSLIALILILLSGCTAYREVSRGSIEPHTPWHVIYGGGDSYFPQEGSALRKDNQSIVLIPCNYGEKDVFMIFPIPAPLGSIPGVPRENGFVVVISIFSEGESIELDVKNIVLTLSDGRKFQPEKVKKAYRRCENYNQPGEENIWKDSEQKQIGQQLIDLSILFPIAPPAVADTFTISLGSLRLGKEEVKIPEVFFKKGSAWGGW